MKKERATPEQIAEARKRYQNPDIEIDDTGLTSRDENDSHGAWIQAWVWIED